MERKIIGGVPPAPPAVGRSQGREVVISFRGEPRREVAGWVDDSGSVRCVAGDRMIGAEQLLELVDLSRLDHVLVEPCRAALVALVRVAETGQRDEEQRFGGKLLAQSTRELDAVHPLECDA